MCVKVNHRCVIAKGRVFDITTENVTLPNGFQTDLEIIRHPGASAIVPVTDKGEVLMLRQYRYAVGEYIWEIPAGTFNAAEDPLVCAQRELIEETGYRATDWVFLNDITPVPGYSDERIHLFMAGGLVPATQNLDRDEILEVCAIGVPVLRAMLSKGQIKDAKTIAGLLLSAALPNSPLPGLFGNPPVD